MACPSHHQLCQNSNLAIGLDSYKTMHIGLLYFLEEFEKEGAIRPNKRSNHGLLSLVWPTNLWWYLEGKRLAKGPFSLQKIATWKLAMFHTACPHYITPKTRDVSHCVLIAPSSSLRKLAMLAPTKKIGKFLEEFCMPSLLVQPFPAQMQIYSIVCTAVLYTKLRYGRLHVRKSHE